MSPAEIRRGDRVAVWRKGEVVDVFAWLGTRGIQWSLSEADELMTLIAYSVAEELLRDLELTARSCGYSLDIAKPVLPLSRRRSDVAFSKVAP